MKMKFEVMKMKLIVILTVCAMLIGTVGIASSHGYKGRLNGASHTREFSNLNITANHTRAEDIFKERMEAEKSALIQTVKQKLGLDGNATNDEMKNALSVWAEQNKDLLKGLAIQNTIGLYERMHNKEYRNETFFKKGNFRVNKLHGE